VTLFFIQFAEGSITPSSTTAITGVNEEYERQYQAMGLRVSARGIHVETRAVELSDDPFFIATLFQPQLSSRPETPHPVWLAFLQAAMRFRKARS
jgi:CTP synthase (UTP-ammonia lyase)